MTIPFKLLLLNGELSLSGDDNFVHARVTRPSDGKSVLTSCAVHGFGGYETAVATLLRDTANHVTQGAWQTLTLHGHEAEIADLKAQLTVAKRERDIAIDRAGGLTREVEELLSEVQMVKLRLAGVQIERNTAQEQLTLAKRERDAATADAVKVREDLARLSTENGQLKAHQRYLREKVTKLAASPASYIDDVMLKTCDALRERANDDHQTIAELREINAKLSRELARCTEAVKDKFSPGLQAPTSVNDDQEKALRDVASVFTEAAVHEVLRENERLRVEINTLRAALAAAPQPADEVPGPEALGTVKDQRWRERFENLRRRVKAAIDSVSR